MSDPSDPSYWRHYEACGRWSAVDCEDPHSVPSDDYDEVWARLHAIVPRKILRDGLEEAEVPLIWWEIDESVEPDPQARKALRWAARNLDVLTSLIEFRDEEAQGPSSASLERAVTRAVELLREYRIHYEGWSETYLFPDPKTGELRWIRAAWGAALLARLDHLPTKEKGAWRAKYPWRSCQPLSDWWSWEEAFRKQTYSPLWHALRILSLHDELRLLLQDEVRREAASIGFQIGLSLQSIAKKPAEYDLMQRRKRDEKASAKGVLATPANKARKQAPYDYLDRMAEIDPSFSSLSNSERRQLARKWAANHDRGKGRTNQLFHPSGRFLSPRWFDDWVVDNKARVTPKADIRSKRDT